MTSFRTRIVRPRLTLALALSGLTASLLWQPGASAAPAVRKVDAVSQAAPLSLGADIARLGPPIRLSVGKSTLRSLTRAVSQIAVNDPKVAGARLLGSSSELYIWGLAPGSTNLILWDKDHRPVIVDIEVGVDADGLQAQLALVFPRETDLKASSAGGAIVLTGMVSDAVKASQIMAMATAFAQRGAGHCDSRCDASARCCRWRCRRCWRHRRERDQHADHRRAAAGDAGSKNCRGLENPRRPAGRQHRRARQQRQLDLQFPVELVERQSQHDRWFQW